MNSTYAVQTLRNQRTPIMYRALTLEIQTVTAMTDETTFVDQIFKEILMKLVLYNHQLSTS